MKTPLKLLACALAVALAGCASTGAMPGDPGFDVSAAERAVRTESNGDVIEEYRMGGQIRMVKVTPFRGAPYYLMDRTGSGKLQPEGRDVSPVYWELYRW